MGKERTKRKSRKKEKVERERERSFEEEKVPTSHPMVRITIQKIRNKSRANSSRQLYEFINLVWGFVYSFSSFPHVHSLHHDNICVIPTFLLFLLDLIPPPHISCVCVQSLLSCLVCFSLHRSCLVCFPSSSSCVNYLLTLENNVQKTCFDCCIC